MEKNNILQILFLYKEFKIATAKYLKISENNGIYSIKILDLKLINDISSEFLIGKELVVKIYLNRAKLMLLTLIINSNEIIEIDRNIFYLEEVYTDEIYTFHQRYLDIFYGWYKGKEYSWRDFKVQQERNEWLRCCYFWNGVPVSLKLDKEYVLNDEKELKTPLDLHCLLSEVFFGKRGYFGAESNAFIDCLTSLDPFLEKLEKKIILVINNFAHINYKVSQEIGYNGYLFEIAKELEASNFIIVKK
ncbi:hypothetical protein O2K51_11050 [Apibacter raozihei]|uniref:hypothetical protein n=1 Tax=Apibacter raozihei TaxID=2500547 RepID=UPI000FE334D1|nr:hypothetical protein [Apibacter raozihei]